MQGLLGKLDQHFAVAGLALTRMRRTRGEEPLTIVKRLLRCAGVRKTAGPRMAMEAAHLRDFPA